MQLRDSIKEIKSHIKIKNNTPYQDERRGLNVYFIFHRNDHRYLLDLTEDDTGKVAQGSSSSQDGHPNCNFPSFPSIEPGKVWNIVLN